MLLDLSFRLLNYLTILAIARIIFITKEPIYEKVIIIYHSIRSTVTNSLQLITHTREQIPISPIPTIITF